jgi:PAS domain S-box-containing protein
MEKKLNSSKVDINNKNEYQEIYLNAPLPFQSLDINGYFININPMWLNILGYSRNEVIGKWFGDFLTEESLETFKKSFPRFKKAGFIDNVQFKMRKKNNETIFVSFNGKIGYDSAGNFQQTYCIFQDISEEKRLKNELKTIEWLLTRDENDLTLKNKYIPSYGDLTTLNNDRTILDSVGKVTLLNITTDILDLLETSIAIYEKNGDYALGIHSSGWCRTLDHFSRIKCKACSNEEAIKSGNWICHESCWTNAGKVAVEEKKIVDIECSGGIRLYAVPIYANKEIVGVISVGYGNSPLEDENINKISEKFQIAKNHLLEISKSYKRRPNYILELAKKTIRTSASLIGTLVEKKIIEDELRKSELAAQSASRAKSEFLANMSHEIRTPLNGVIGFSSLLLDSDLSPTQKEYMKNIKYSADNLLDLINDILDFSKIEAGKLELVYSAVKLKNILSDLSTLYKYETKKNKISFKVEVDEKVPEYVKTDQVRFRQILVNLLSNAFKFTEKGEITLSCKVLSVSDKNVHCYFSVKDDGIGISVENQKKIFRTFTQIDGTTTRKYGGTGLGLAICSNLLNKMDSSLKLDSAIGEGSNFYFEIDFDISENNDFLSEINKNKESNNFNRSKYRTILVVEDDYINRILAVKFLHKILDEPVILQAENGKVGIELFKKHNPDMILMDIRMPGMNGFETTRVIRIIEKDKKIPIIAITADVLKETKETCLQNGMNGFIIKPIEYEQFLKTLCEILD